jgi:hypothetical protein
MKFSQAHVVSQSPLKLLPSFTLGSTTMAINRIQFQPGLSLPEFFKLYGTEPLCAQALESARWPEGFACPRCSGAAHCVLRNLGHKVFQCNTCRHQTSLIAGTVFQGTKLPLTVWFLAIYLISQAKTGLSALALKRHRRTAALMNCCHTTGRH